MDDPMLQFVAFHLPLLKHVAPADASSGSEPRTPPVWGFGKDGMGVGRGGQDTGCRTDGSKVRVGAVG